MHILLVEDNQLNALSMSRMLERRGHTVAHVNGGRKALEMLSTRCFDLILMDLMMPDMDGFETAKRIRGLSGPVSRVPIVAVTALLASQALERCLQVGMNSFLTKPVDGERFREVAERLGPPPCPA
ncbi:MAG: response regulator [Desulfovibrio sp.]